MRIALDLQACQTHSRRRGIGRYANALSAALLRSRDEGNEFIVSLDGTYPREATEVEVALQGLVPQSACRRYFYPHSQKAHEDPSCVLRPAADALVRSHYARLSPDVLHINSMFEGLVEPAGGLGLLGSLPGALTSVTLYDLIPAIFPQHYLADPNHRAWYQRRLASLQSFDVLLCISEATKRDAKALLGLPEHRLAVIYAGLDAIFKPSCVDANVRENLFSRLGIERNFVLYTGNDDFRKNLRGAISAFARVPAEHRLGVQLVLNQVDDGPSLRKLAAVEGLAESDLVLTGRVSDEDLVLLYQTCEVFFFPSRYEGFGLPVLEAMACGAPTIAANNSSLPEIIGRKDAMFDVDSTDEAAALLSRALNDEGYRRSLVSSGQQRAAEFTWERSARLAREAWTEGFKLKDVARKSMVSGRMQRPRIAMVTPMPPDQTGIASYVQDLLPSLAYHFDIDLYTTSAERNSSHGLRVFAWDRLEAQASRYDHVVYQFGNSDFHTHMFDLLDKVPGTVVLHDVFLSSILSHMDGALGFAGKFELELDRSHGRGALALARNKGRSEAERLFPASYGVFQSAIAVMVHSEHARELCTLHYPGLADLPRKVTMPQRLAAQPSLSARNAARQALAIRTDEFLIISLGMLGHTKLNHRIVESMAVSSRSVRRKARLIFVGKPDSAAYAEVLDAAAQKLSPDITMQVTGFVSDTDLELYFAAADCAVQLRTTSKGETSRALLDCFAHGVPTVINDYASFREVPADIVCKVSAEATVEELAAAIDRLMDDDEERSRLAEAGWQHIARHHQPILTAQDYATVIHDAIAMGRAASDELVVNLSSIFHDSSCSTSHDLAAVEKALVQQRDTTRPPKVFTDVSHIIGTDLGTGIQRVVRNVARELMLAERPSMMSYHAVALSDGQMMLADAFVADSWGVPQSRIPQTSWPIAGDVFLMIDSIWDRTEAFAETIAKFHAQGARVGCFIYDLLPIRFPQYFVDYMPAMFDKWLSFAVKNCDFIVCISRAVADDLALWIEENRVDPGLLRIGHVHLGSDIREAGNGDGTTSAEMCEAMAGGRSVLMVGTVEPRKRHDVVLAAFERAWAAGSDLRLVIVGKQGWAVDALCQRIKNHAQFGRKLFWFAKANDADLQHAYTTAQRLIQASDGEGFGLPIVEAARHGVPLLLSDIPVFREIAGGCAEYFPAGDVSGLLDRLTSEAPLRQPDPAIAISWTQTAHQLELLLLQGGWDHVYG